MAETRLVQLPTGHRVWVKLSDADILWCIGQALPTAWREMVKARMGGVSIEELWRHQSKLDEREFRSGLAVAFQRVDRYKWRLAERRAGVEAMKQVPTPQAAELERMLER